MENSILKFELVDNIAVITISRPEALNALNKAFFNELEPLIERLNTDTAIKVAIITGEKKAFVAGADIAEMVEMNQAEGKAFGERGQNCFRQLEQCRVPVIAAINGFALGGGLELAMSCDIRIANAKAKFGMPEVGLGLIPGYAGTQRLPRLVGLGNAKYLIYSAEIIDATTAMQMGLLQKVVTDGDLMEECTKLAKQIASKGAMAVQKAKIVINRVFDNDFEEGSQAEAKAFSTQFENEGTEGMQAFLEKRKPNF